MTRRLKSSHELPTAVRVAAGTGKVSVLNTPFGRPISSTWERKALLTPLLGQSAYIWTAPKKNGFGCCVGRKKSSVMLVGSAAVRLNCRPRSSTKFFAASDTECRPCRRLVLTPGWIAATVEIQSLGSSKPRMSSLPARSSGSPAGSRKIAKPDSPNPTSRRVTPNAWS